VQTQLAHNAKASQFGMEPLPMVVLPATFARYAGGDMRRRCRVADAGGGFHSLIACANLAGLALVRISRRTQEIGDTACPGGISHRRSAAALEESLVLALQELRQGWVGVGDSAREHGVLPDEMIRGGLRWTGGVLCASVLVVTSLLFGALPALQTRRVDLRSSLAAGRLLVARVACVRC